LEQGKAQTISCLLQNKRENSPDDSQQRHHLTSISLAFPYFSPLVRNQKPVFGVAKEEFARGKTVQ